MPAESESELIVDSAAKADEAKARKKKGLVVVLVIALTVAILTQPKATDSEDVEGIPPGVGRPATTSSVAKRSDTNTQKAQLIESRSSQLSQTRVLSRTPLEEIAQIELFVAETGQAQDVAVRPTPRVQAVYGTPNSSAALLDKNIVHDGQAFPGGGTVVRITPQGVRISHE